MPKSPTIILKNMLAEKTPYELLDIYRYKNYDLIRIKDKASNKVYLVKLEKHVTDLATEEDFNKALEQILKQVKEKK